MRFDSSIGKFYYVNTADATVHWKRPQRPTLKNAIRGVMSARRLVAAGSGRALGEPPSPAAEAALRQPAGCEAPTGLRAEGASTTSSRAAGRARARGAGRDALRAGGMAVGGTREAGKLGRIAESGAR
jgi:hypothetical protein